MKKTLASYKAVFLDASDTIITAPESHKTFHAYLRGKGFQTDERSVRELLGAAMERYYFHKEKDESAVCSEESDRNYWMHIYESVMNDLGAYEHFEAAYVRKLCGELYELFVSPEIYILYDDVLPALERLKEEGYRIGIVSNFAPTLRAIFKSLGVLHYFDPIIVSTEVGLEKPNPAIFEIALEQSGLRSTEVLFIGDHDVNDVWAAEQAGIDAVKMIRSPKGIGKGIHTLMELFTRGGQIHEHG